MQARNVGLHRYSTFAGVLAAAGLPLYMHAPKFYVDQYDLSLTMIAAALLGLRMLDFVQDPVLGWVVDHLGLGRLLGFTTAAVRHRQERGVHSRSFVW